MEFAQLWRDCSCSNFQVALEIEMESPFLTLEMVVDETNFCEAKKFHNRWANSICWGRLKAIKWILGDNCFANYSFQGQQWTLNLHKHCSRESWVIDIMFGSITVLTWKTDLIGFLSRKSAVPKTKMDSTGVWVAEKRRGHGLTGLMLLTLQYMQCIIVLYT